LDRDAANSVPMPARSEQPAARYLQRRAESKGLRPRFAAAVIAGVWLIAIAGFGILEHLVDPETFENVWLGMWWATQTVTTVGYGDTVPQQADGQVVATVLMIGGLSLFAVITGTITSVFVTRAQAEQRGAENDLLVQRIDQISADLCAMREELARFAAGESREPPSA
jgi:voltage-gated potassium channel